MDLMKYVIVAGISLVIAVIAGFMGNWVSAVLIFILLFGSYIMWNVARGIKDDPKEVTQTPPLDTPKQDN